jgi:hypothetical protein
MRAKGFFVSSVRAAGGYRLTSWLRIKGPFGNHEEHEFYGSQGVTGSSPQKNARITKILGQSLLRSVCSLAASTGSIRGSRLHDAVERDRNPPPRVLPATVVLALA